MSVSIFPFQHSLEGRRFFITAGMQFNEVPAGKFLMGSNNRDTRAEENEKPRHIVDLPYDYYMARFPITIKNMPPTLNRMEMSIGCQDERKNLIIPLQM